MDCLAEGFRQVDTEAEVARLAACLAFLDLLPSFSMYKAYVCEVVTRSGGPSLDVGCGLGLDVLRVARRMPNCTAFGVDLSQRFLDSAREKAASLGFTNTSFRCMDARCLQFPDEMFASTRVDRSLQHMAEPGKVIGEMVRVTRKGGEIILAEPDWGSFFLGDRSVVAEEISAYFGGKFRNPDIGRRVGALLKASGAEVLDLRGYALIAGGAMETDRVFDVKRTCDLLDAQGGVGKYLDWWKAVSRSDEVLGSVTIFVAVGRKTRA